MTVVKPLDRNEVEQRRVERKKVVMRELRRRQREEALRSRPPAPISLVTGRSWAEANKKVDLPCS